MHPLDELIERDMYGRQRSLKVLMLPGPSGYFDGKRIGIPYSADAYGLIYRTDIFEEAGISADWETWDEFFVALDALEMHLEGSDISPNVFAFGAVRSRRPPSSWACMMAIWSIQKATMGSITIKL